MKQWRSFVRTAISKHAIREQFRPGSHFVRIMMFTLVAAITMGVIYSFVGQYITGTRASTESITVTTGASNDKVNPGEEFFVTVLFSAPAGRKVSQLDLRMQVKGSSITGTGEAPDGFITLVENGYESGEIGKQETDYFDTEVLEQYTPYTVREPGQYRLVLSARKPEAQLAQRVLVKVKFRAESPGYADFVLTSDTMEIVGPGGTGDPVSFTVGEGSSTTARVQIGERPAVTPPPSATPSPAPELPVSPKNGLSPTSIPATAQPTPTRTADRGPTPTITIAPNPTCSNTTGCIPGTAPEPVSVLPGWNMPAGPV